MNDFCDYVKLLDVFILEIISIAFALSADTFAVSTAGGCTHCKIPARTKILAMIMFAFSQTSLTFIGWLIGENAYNFIESFVRICAFVLLATLGLKMCVDTLRNKDEHIENFLCPLKPKLLFILSIATSIDALAVGVSLAFTKVNIAVACIVIALITAFASILGISLGKAATRLSNRLPLVGGLILIVIAVGILNFD